MLSENARFDKSHEMQEAMKIDVYSTEPPRCPVAPLISMDK